MRKSFLIAVMIFMASMIIRNAHMARAQSFDCGMAHTKDQNAVCADPYLRKLDAIEAYLHADLKHYLKARRKQDRGWAEHWETRLLEGQRGFIRSRAECDGDPACIAKVYENHNLNLMRMWRDILH